MTRRTLVALAASVVAMLGLPFGLRELARSRTVQLFGGLVARVDTSDPVVALTFDDGPTTAALNEIIEVLATRGVRATFFVTGAELAGAPEAGRQLVAAGHELGNHSYSHQRMVLKSPAFVRREIESTDALIRASGQTAEIYVRPPFGYKLVALPWFLRSTSRTSVTWDLDPDSQRETAASASAIVAYVLERVRPGSIILLHVWYPSRRASRAALPMIIDEVQKKGYRFVTVSELLRMT